MKHPSAPVVARPRARGHGRRRRRAAGRGARQRGAGDRAEGWVRDPQLLGPQRGAGREHREGRGRPADEVPDPVGEREADARLDHRGREDEVGQAGDHRRRPGHRGGDAGSPGPRPTAGSTPGEFDLFTISAGPLPTNTGKLTFKAIQTYSDGTIVNWIQATVKGAPEPEHPAPVLTLTKASSGHH